MENKLTGIELDRQHHMELLSNFTDFIKNFSPLLDSAEKYSQMLYSIKLLDSCEEALSKLELIEEICQTLTNMVPLFVKFSILEDKLEKLLVKSV